MATEFMRRKVVVRLRHDKRGQVDVARRRRAHGKGERIVVKASQLCGPYQQ